MRDIFKASRISNSRQSECFLATMSKRKHEGEKEKVVLAYSGGLDTSVILVWLVEKGMFPESSICKILSFSDFYRALPHELGLCLSKSMK